MKRLMEEIKRTRAIVKRAETGNDLEMQQAEVENPKPIPPHSGGDAYTTPYIPTFDPGGPGHQGPVFYPEPTTSPISSDTTPYISTFDPEGPGHQGPVFYPEPTANESTNQVPTRDEFDDGVANKMRQWRSNKQIENNGGFVTDENIDLLAESGVPVTTQYNPYDAPDSVDSKLYSKDDYPEVAVPPGYTGEYSTVPFEPGPEWSKWLPLINEKGPWKGNELGPKDKAPVWKETATGPVLTAVVGGKTLQLTLPELQAAIRANPELIKSIGKDSMTMQMVPEYSDPISGEGGYGVNWYVDSNGNLKGWSNRADGTRIYRDVDGNVFDAKGNKINLADLRGAGWASGRVEGSESGEDYGYAPMGLRKVIRGRKAYYYDQNGKRVSPKDFAKLRGINGSTEMIQDVPTFNLPDGNPYTTYGYKVIKSGDKNKPYSIVAVSPNGPEIPIPSMTNIDGAEVQRITGEDPVVNRTYPMKSNFGPKFKDFNATHVTVDASDPRNPVYTLHAANGTKLVLNPATNGYHADILRGLAGQKSFTMGPKGPITHTINVEGMMGSNPYEFKDAVQGGTTEFAPSPETGPIPDTTEVPPEETVEDEKADEEEKEEIFNETVKKYMALGIPIGIAVSLAMWALSGAKPEGMLGSLAAGAGGGALLGGLGGHYGWFDKKEEGEEGEEASAVAE